MKHVKETWRETLVWKLGKGTWKGNLKREDLQEEEKSAQILRIHYRHKRAYLSINLFVFRDELKFPWQRVPQIIWKLVDVFPEINIYAYMFISIVLVGLKTLCIHA